MAAVGQVNSMGQRWLRSARECGLLPILILAAVVRLYGLTDSAIWCDEGSSLLLSQYSPALTWFHTAHDVHPPLYYLLLHGWMSLFGNSLFSIRFMSVVPALGTVGLVIWLVRLIATRRAAVLAGVLVALLPIAVRYSQEVRMYSLMGFWLVGATIALVLWVKHPQRHRYLVIYAVLMTASFYTHYFTALCVMSHWAYLLVLRLSGSGNKLITRPAWWLANVAIVALYLPWIPSLVDQLQHLEQLKLGGDVGWIEPETLTSMPSVLWQFLTYDEGLGLPGLVFVLLPLVVGLVTMLILRADRSEYRFNALIAAYTLVPLLVIALASLATPLLVDRYLMFAALGLPIILAIALDRLAEHYRVWALAGLLLVIGVQGVGLKNIYTTAPDRIDRMVDYVNQQYVAGDRIVVSDLFWYFSYVYYNRTAAAPMLYTPPQPDGRSGRPNAYGFGTLVEDSGEKTYLDTLTDLPRGTGRVWLISSSEAPYDFAPVPSGWKAIDELKVDDTLARLYAICPDEGCP